MGELTSAAGAGSVVSREAYFAARDELRKLSKQRERAFATGGLEALRAWLASGVADRWLALEESVIRRARAQDLALAMAWELEWFQERRRQQQQAHQNAPKNVTNNTPKNAPQAAIVPAPAGPTAARPPLTDSREPAPRPGATAQREPRRFEPGGLVWRG